MVYSPDAGGLHGLVAEGGRMSSPVDVGAMMLTGRCPLVLPRSPSRPLAEAFAAKHMPDLGQEVEDFQVQTWRVQNWSASSKRMVGADFFCGGHKW